MLKLPDDYMEIKQDMNKEMVEFMDLFILKHATIPHTLSVSFDVKERPLGKFYTATFRDERVAGRFICGSVAWWFGSSVNSYEYVVSSRLIENNKYAGWNKSEHHSMRTKDVKKALRNALEYILPVQVNELVGNSERKAKEAHMTWRDECRSAVTDLNLGSSVIYEELKHLLELGVVFKTPEFKKAVERIKDYEEYVKRTEAQMNMESIVFAFGNVYYKDREYPNAEALPQDVYQKTSILKLLDDNGFVPQVGYKFDTNTFWIYTEKNN